MMVVILLIIQAHQYVHIHFKHSISCGVFVRMSCHDDQILNEVLQCQKQATSSVIHDKVD